MTRSNLLASWRLGVRSLGVLAAVSVTLAAHPSTAARGALSAVEGQMPLEFEVASIKRNTSERPTPGARSTPASGQYSMTWTTARALALRVYPVRTLPALVIGLPAWADSEHYDVVAKGKPGATRDEETEMWKGLLTDRMKLAAHYEIRPREAYRLVLSRGDGKLGPQLKPSPLKCDGPDASGPPGPPPAGFLDAIKKPGDPVPRDVEEQLMSRCRGSFNVGNTTYAGAMDIEGLIFSLSMFTRMDRPVVDETGLAGLYAFKLTAARVTVGPAVGTDDAAPSLFTAIQEQLGLKLEPTVIQGQVLVIDHIERPTEN